MMLLVVIGAIALMGLLAGLAHRLWIRVVATFGLFSIVLIGMLFVRSGLRSAMARPDISQDFKAGMDFALLLVPKIEMFLAVVILAVLALRGAWKE